MTRVIQAFFQGRSGAKPPRPRVTPLNQSQMQLAGSIARRLPEGLRTTMEAFFRTDFSDVRIHQGPQAQTIGAQAFTMGSGIWFAAGQYEPNTQRGQRLIGHELAHVVQQRSGRVHAPGGSLFTIVNDAALEAEADRLGTQAAASVISPAPAQSKNVGALQLKRLAGAAQSSHCGARSDADRVGRRPQAVIIQPMWNALFGTGTLSNAPDPARAEGRVYRYLEGQTEHARDDQGAHWYKHPNGAWISIRAHDGQPPTHGRGVANHDYIRAFTHRLKNISHLQGGWSRLPIRSAFTSSKTRNFDVAQAYHPQKRTYSQTMETAAEIETTIADLNRRGTLATLAGTVGLITNGAIWRASDMRVTIRKPISSPQPGIRTPSKWQLSTH